jgi:hypothetical protein
MKIKYLMFTDLGGFPVLFEATLGNIVRIVQEGAHIGPPQHEKFGPESPNHP